MTNRRNRHPARRRFLKQAAAITMSPATALGVPALALAQSPQQQANTKPLGATDSTAADQGTPHGARQDSGRRSKR
jgi:hypothetical protein